MTVKFNMTRDINGYNGFGVKISDVIYNAAMTSGSESTCTVPSDNGLGNAGNVTSKWIAIFSFDPGASFFVAINHTASGPAGATLALANDELNPAAREVNAGDVIHIYNAGNSTANVSVSLYLLQ